MCFVHDYEWCADISEEFSAPCTVETKCDECRRPILVGQMKHNIFQQEHECCRACEEGECSCPRDKDGDCVDGCACEKPDYGETCDYGICNDCHLFLQAIEKAEIEAGCAPMHSRPSLMGMVEEINEGGREEGEKYFAKAEVLFPELLSSGYLNFLHNKMFYEDWPLRADDNEDE